MGYAKKILILGEVTKGFGTGAVKGVATVEQIGPNTKCTVDIFNLKDVAKGLFAFGITSDSSPVYVERLGLKGKISATFSLGEIDIKGNMYCVLCYISEENIIPIAWGANNAKKLWETNILDGFKSITRPKMFAGKIEKVEPKKELYSSIVQKEAPKPTVQTQQVQPINKTNQTQKDYTVKYQETAPKSIYEKIKNKESQNINSGTVLGRASHDGSVYKPVAVPKITVAKISKVLDDAISDYDDDKISDVAFYPPKTEPRDIQKESAAAALDVSLAQNKTGFYEAFEEVPRELVDEYKDNTVRNSFYKTQEEEQYDQYDYHEEYQTQISQAPYKEQFETYKNKEHNNIEDISSQKQQDVDEYPRYISSWGGYNNIKLKDTNNSNNIKKEAAAEDMNEQNEKEQEQEQEQEQTKEGKYFESVKDRLDKIFEQSPPEERLNKLMPDTYWVKVELAKDQYYVIGLIGEGPDYIGYGVPGEYSVNPPKELQGYCKWLALDQNKPYGEGYWMMYQDADNGESINLDLI
ncbi:MAG TPA: hypothetical protein VIL26_02705 [Clostridia bacterium]